MVTAFVALERRQDVRASLAIATGTLMKLFPAAAIPFMLAHPRPRRVLATFVLVVAALLAAPLFVTSPGELVAQYRSWLAILFSDERDLTFARSIMVVFRNWSGVGAPNWIFQLFATFVLVTPLALRRTAWADPLFRRNFLASLLIYVVIFNHQAENASYIIAAVGLAIWFLGVEKSWLRVLLLLMCLGGLEAIPYTIVWFWLQFDLLDGGRIFGWIASKASQGSGVAADGAEA
jgi:hypothetical protein